MDPIGRTLNPEEQALLTILSQDGRDPADCTAIGLALTLERDTLEVASVLNRLEHDGLVTSEGKPGMECWSTSATP